MLSTQFIVVPIPDAGTAGLRRSFAAAFAGLGLHLVFSENSRVCQRLLSRLRSCT